MKISDIQNYLEELKILHGDVEVYEALHEYGRRTIDEIDLKQIIYFENEMIRDHTNCSSSHTKRGDHRYCKTVSNKDYLLVGRH